MLLKRIFGVFIFHIFLQYVSTPCSAALRSTTEVYLRRDYIYEMEYDNARPINEKFEDVMLTEYVYANPPYHTANVTYMEQIPIFVEDRIPYKVLKNKPIVSWACNRKKLYTIFFTNLESNRTFWMYKQYHHWLVIDIPNCNPNEGTELMPYLRVPGQLDQAYHLYVLYVFEQEDKLNLTTYIAQPYDLKMLRWVVQIAPFVWQHKLKGPVSGTFFFQYN